MAKNLHEFIRKNAELAANDFGMIQSGDRILVALSGGVDSFVLLKILLGKKIYLPSDISIIAAHIDLGFAREDKSHLQKMESYLQANDVEYYIEKTEIGPYAHSEANKKNPCFICSRWRRKKLFEIAEKNKCNKIAFGHHKDDVIETLLLNIFFGREISTMKPKQALFQGKYFIIRPLIYLWEKKIKECARQANFPVFKNPCPSAENSKRKYIKNLLRQLEQEDRKIKENIFKSLRHVKKDYLWIEETGQS
jgi:tRNA 2-thiocytidine biosynthesis protein TtcA